MIIPDVSIITANYNHEKWIERCIRSVLNQKFINEGLIEHIIIDDASTDNSDFIINKNKHENLVYIKNEENMGLPKSLNKGIRQARGRYIMRVDSDDYLSRDFVHIHRLFLDLNRICHAVSSDYFLVNDSEELLERKSCKDEFIACGILFRKEVLIDLGMYNEDFRFREGHELMVRFEEKNFNMGFSNMPLYKYRMHQHNRTKSKEIKQYDDKLSKL